MRRLLATLLVAAAAAGCSPTVDLVQSVAVTEVKTGWFDLGILDSGQNKLVPSISLKVQNTSSDAIARVQLNAIFHRVSEPNDGWGEHYVSAIDSSGLAAGASTNAIVLRSTLGYTATGQTRAEMLRHASFVDATVTIFGKQGRGGWIKLGEYPIDRQLLTQ
ncbi:MAG: hypothetical protein ABL986_17775 [Vicinamibacterales bacterium]